jgi:hypothetical protein
MEVVSFSYCQKSVYTTKNKLLKVINNIIVERVLYIFYSTIERLFW